MGAGQDTGLLTQDLPFLDLEAPGFSTRGPEVREARSRHWCARTPFGFAVLRHRQAGLILRDRRFRQGSYAWPDRQGLTGSFAAFWTESVIAQEGDHHKQVRRLAQSALSEDDILRLVPAFEADANTLLDRISGPIDFVARFTEPFAGRAIARLLGEPPEEAAQIARDASLLGLAMHVDAKTHEDAFNPATDRLMARAERLMTAAQIRPGDGAFVGRLLKAAKALGITDESVLRNLIVISIFGGVDTTRAQLAFAIGLFADAPAEWFWLRANPDAIPRAIDETIRLRPTTTWSTREAVEDVSISGVSIPKGATVHILAHATATDPATGHDGTFSIRAPRKIHFGFGGGAHHCLGQFVARTDMAAALRVLLGRINRIEWAGSPEYLPDTGNTGPVSLPVTLVPD